MHVFLDLEETLIISWDDPTFCNLQKLRKFFKDREVESFSVFSFAIWDEKDRVFFCNNLKDSCESALQSKVRSFPSVDDLVSIIGKRNRISIDRHDLLQLFGKQNSFIEFCFNEAEKNPNHDNHFVLIDDVVIDCVIESKHLNLKIEIINVDSLR
jgi:hypothetical protein